MPQTCSGHIFGRPQGDALQRIDQKNFLNQGTNVRYQILKCTTLKLKKKKDTIFAINSSA